MATNETQSERMDRLLREWASWLRNGKQTGGGWPTKNILHESWLPPAPGSRVDTRTVAVSSDARERAMHAAIGELSVRQANTVVLVYLMRTSVADAALQLACGEGTVRGRIMDAKRKLAALDARCH